MRSKPDPEFRICKFCKVVGIRRNERAVDQPCTVEHLEVVQVQR